MSSWSKRALQTNCNYRCGLNKLGMIWFSCNLRWGLVSALASGDGQHKHMSEEKNSPPFHLARGSATMLREISKRPYCTRALTLFLLTQEGCMSQVWVDAALSLTDFEIQTKQGGCV
eukprot:2330287-Amphidinium_carterae.1